MHHMHEICTRSGGSEICTSGGRKKTKSCSSEIEWNSKSVQIHASYMPIHTDAYGLGYISDIYT